MRKAKIITIEGIGEVTVKEVSPYAAYHAMSATNKLEELTLLVSDCISIPKEKLVKLYPSEIEELIDAFIEVNSSFLAIAGKLKLEVVIANIMTEVFNKLSTILPEVFVNSYKKVMEKLPGTMAGLSS